MLTINKPNFTITLKTLADAGAKRHCHRGWMLTVERAIRPLTVQRKNSLFFGSTKGALNSAVYNTFIETCKQVGVSFRDYFRAVLKELGSGREDYENLLSMTIGGYYSAQSRTTLIKQVCKS